MPALMLLTPFTTFANTALPYFGPDQKNCGITQPAWAKDADAGFVASENCSFIYILPPQRGKLKLAAPFYQDTVSVTCPEILAARQEIVRSQPAQANNPEEKIRLGSLRIKELDRYEKLVDPYYKGSAAIVYGGAFLGWNELVAAYRASNPHSRAAFVQMPIRIGAFSLSERAVGEKEDSFFGERNLLSYLEVSGLRFPDKQTQGTDFPGMNAFFGTNAIIMGQAAGLQMGINMRGACTMFNQQANPQLLLSGTYTYLYPVQTQAAYVITFDPAALKGRIITFFSKKNKLFTLADLKSAIIGEDSPAVNIEIMDGAFPEGDMGSKLSEKYKDILLTKVTEYMIALLAERANIAIASNTSVYTENHWQRDCNSGFLGFGKSCDTKTWTTTREEIDWPGVVIELSKHFRAPSGRAKEYKTFYSMGTTAFMPD